MSGLAYFTPDGGDGPPEVVEVVRRARGMAPFAYVVQGLDSGRTFLAWPDELAFAPTTLREAVPR